MVLQTITFPAGSGLGAQQCRSIVVEEDGIAEIPDIESFFLDLLAGANSVIGNPGRTTIDILDSSKLKSGCFTERRCQLYTAC